MDYITKESVAATIDSYQKAIGEFFEISPYMKPSCSSNNNYLFPIELENSYHAVSSNKLMKNVNRIFIYRHELFDFARPLIEKNTWVYRSDFFKITSFIDKEFSHFGNFYGYAGIEEYFDEEEQKLIPAKAAIPACMKDYCKRQISLKVGEKSWGLSQWLTNYKEIESFCDNCSESIQLQYKDSLKEAQKEVDKWKIAVEKLKSEFATI